MDNIGYFIALYSFLSFLGDCFYSSLLSFSGFISLFSVSYLFRKFSIIISIRLLTLLFSWFAMYSNFFLFSSFVLISICGFLLGNFFLLFIPKVLTRCITSDIIYLIKVIHLDIHYITFVLFLCYTLGELGQFPFWSIA